MSLLEMSIPIRLKQQILITFLCVSLCCFIAAFFMEAYVLVGLPFAFLYLYQCIRSPKSILWIFFLLVPFSTEVSFGSMGTDLPSEPIMWSLFAVFFLILFQDIRKMKASTLRTPISALLIIHVVWIAFTAIFSTDSIVSLKFLIAKLWYVIPFYFLPLIVLKDTKDYRALFKVLILAMSIALVYVMLRHFQRGFSFDTINKAVRPIFRNHVNYAAMIALVIPYIWALWRKPGENKNILWLAVLSFFLVACYLSFTRAAFVSIFLAVGAYVLLRMRLLVPAIFVSLGVLVAIMSFMIEENNYLEFAPDYERTVAHEKFDNLVEATYKMEDISTMERLHRWVAGVHMINDKPWLGFGPGCFYEQYVPYTVEQFETYVSDNPEKSGIHNYYMMVFVEQGVLGFILFLLLTFIPLIIGASLYRNVSGNEDKIILLAAILSLIIIDAVIIINDLIEADKVGPLYFLNLAIINMFYVGKKKASDNRGF